MGALGCGSTCIKYLLFFFNFLCAVGGLTLAALGGFSLYALKDLKSSEQMFMHTFSAVFLAVGVIIFVVSFYGCCGAVRESHCMLVTFAVLLLTLIVLEVAGAATIFSKKGDIQIFVGKALNKMFDAADNHEQSAIVARDSLQRGFQCCGRESPVQWGTLGSLPDSCCSNPPCNVLNAYHKGCIPTVKNLLEENSEKLAYGAIGVAVVEFLEVIFALGLATSIRRSERRY